MTDNKKNCGNDNDNTTECPWCGGAGLVDSGGQRADGSWVDVICGACAGSGKFNKELLKMFTGEAE